MERFKITDLGEKRVVMAFDGSGWRITEAVEIHSGGVCPACGTDTRVSPGVLYTVPRAKHKGKDPLVRCMHEAEVVEEARRVLGV